MRQPGGNDQVPGGGRQGHLRGVGVAPADLGRVAARRNDVGCLKVRLRAGVAQVNAIIQLLVAERLGCGQRGMPLRGVIAEKGVDDAWHGGFRVELGGGVCPHELLAEVRMGQDVGGGEGQGVGAGERQGEDHLGRGEGERWALHIVGLKVAPLGMRIGLGNEEEWETRVAYGSWARGRGESSGKR